MSWGVSYLRDKGNKGTTKVKIEGERKQKRKLEAGRACKLPRYSKYKDYLSRPPSVSFLSFLQSPSLSVTVSAKNHLAHWE